MQNLDFLAQAALMAVVALGAWTAMGDGMILGWFRRLVERFVHHFLAHPLATCPRCMCSVWGIAALLVCGLGVGISWNFELDVLVLNWSRIVQIPVLILAAVGIQELLQRN
jgi:hypothetical protein